MRATTLEVKVLLFILRIICIISFRKLLRFVFPFTLSFSGLSNTLLSSHSYPSVTQFSSDNILTGCFPVNLLPSCTY